MEWVLLILGIILGYILLSFFAIRVYFHYSKQHKPYIRLFGRSAVLAFFWSPEAVLALVIDLLFSYTINWHTLWHESIPWFMKAWFVYFVLYAFAMAIKKRAITLGTWE